MSRHAKTRKLLNSCLDCRLRNDPATPVVGSTREHAETTNAATWRCTLRQLRTAARRPSGLAETRRVAEPRLGPRASGRNERLGASAPRHLGPHPARMPVLCHLCASNTTGR